MRPDPVGHLLARDGFGVREAAGPEDADEQLAGDRFACSAVDDPGLLAGEVDEGFLAGPVHLTHGGGELAGEAVVVLAELGVAVAVGVIAEVLDPQKLQGHARPAQLGMEAGQVGKGALGEGVRARGGGDQDAELGVIKLGRQRPAQSRLARLCETLADGPQSDRQGPCDRPLREAPVVSEPQDLS